jgi:tetratricopeptide (TPR) repeat protein
MDALAQGAMDAHQRLIDRIDRPAQFGSQCSRGNLPRVPHLNQLFVRRGQVLIALLESHAVEAIRQLSTALSLLAGSKDSPTSSAGKAKRMQEMHCHMLLGRALSMDGKLDQAIVQYYTAFGMDPYSFMDHANFINVLACRGRFGEAVAVCRKALEIAPENPSVRNMLARMLATCPEASVRDGAKAVDAARRLFQGPRSRNPIFLETLAAAYAEAGQFPQAVATATEAVARSSGQTMLALKIQSQLDLYRAGRPYRETPQTEDGQGDGE